MNDRQYGELLHAILDLRGATEHGFAAVDRRFVEIEERWDRRFGALENRVEEGFASVDRRFVEMEERWDRRFGALENRVDRGFCDVCQALGDIRARLTAVEQA